MDPFYVLGLKRNADTGQIRAAYRKQARIAHPDRGGSDLDFYHLTEAYQIALKHRSTRRSRSERAANSDGRDRPHGDQHASADRTRTSHTGSTGPADATTTDRSAAAGATTDRTTDDRTAADGTARTAEDWTEAAALRRQFYHWRQVQAWRRVARGPLVLMLSVQVLLLTVIALVQPSSPLPVVAGALATGLMIGIAATVVAADRVGLLNLRRQ